MATRVNLLLLCVAAATAQFGNIKVDWSKGEHFASASIDPHPRASEGSAVPAVDEVKKASRVEADRSQASADRRDEREALAALRDEQLSSLMERLGGTSDKLAANTLQSRVLARLRTAPIARLSELMLEHGEACTACSERADWVLHTLRALRRPVIARHSLPLFIFDDYFLFPHTLMHLHFFEGRWGLCQPHVYIPAPRCLCMYAHTYAGTSSW